MINEDYEWETLRTNQHPRLTSRLPNYMPQSITLGDVFDCGWAPRCKKLSDRQWYLLTANDIPVNLVDPLPIYDDPDFKYPLVFMMYGQEFVMERDLFIKMTLKATQNAMVQFYMGLAQDPELAPYIGHPDTWDIQDNSLPSMVHNEIPSEDPFTEGVSFQGLIASVMEAKFPTTRAGSFKLLDDLGSGEQCTRPGWRRKYIGPTMDSYEDIDIAKQKEIEQSLETVYASLPNSFWIYNSEDVMGVDEFFEEADSRGELEELHNSYVEIEPPPRVWANFEQLYKLKGTDILVYVYGSEEWSSNFREVIVVSPRPLGEDAS